MQHEYQKSLWDFKKLENEEIIIGKLYRDVNDLIIKLVGNKGSEDNANLIINNIWLGNYAAANDFDFIRSNKIKCIINATNLPFNKFDFISYASFPMSDRQVCQENFFTTLEQAAYFVNQAIQNKMAILIHCKRGHHRSASIVAYYLMTYLNMSLVDALTLIKQYRPTAFRRMACCVKSLISCEYNKNC